MNSNPKWSPNGLKIVFAAQNIQNSSTANVSSGDNYKEDSSDITVIELAPGFAANPDPDVISINN